MDAEEDFRPSETYKVVCSLYPEIFDMDKSICKNYFRQYGKVMRLIFKPKQRSIVVEYTNKNDYLNALSGSSEYDGQSFKVEAYESIIPHTSQGPAEASKKKHREKLVKRHKLTYINPDLVRRPNVSYVDKDEVNEELAAMGGFSGGTDDIVDLTTEEPPPPPKPKPLRVPRLNRVWTREQAAAPSAVPSEKPKKIFSVKKKLAETLAKKKVKAHTKMLTADQLELLKVIKSQAQTVDEKYKVLDARDKLLRLITKKPRLKSSPTVGTCPDMCPEKERLLREIQHQVSIYEQDGASRHCMDHSKAVKQYSRSSADQESPLPHELRPVSVLKMSMTYLMYNIMDLSEKESDVNIGEWFHFLWDRTRGIRKDITQQNLCCQGSVELVEQCARFHIHCSARLMGEDPSVFDQKINTENLTKCLQTLKYMYHDLDLKGIKCSNEAEFRGYIILLNLSDGNFMWEVQELRRDIQRSPEVKFALQIYSAFDKRNYVKFFKLIRSTTYLNACVLMRYFVQVRVQAIETLIKCFTPPKSFSFYPAQDLTNSLFFDDIEATIEFMKTYGIGLNNSNNFMFERSSFTIPEYPFVLERSNCVERKRNWSVGATVNGRALSPEMYMQMQSHEVHNSFDENGCLIQDKMFNEIELSIEDRLLEDEPESRESTPERKNIVTNIFAPKTQPSVTLKRTTSPAIFPPAKEDKSIFNQPKQDVFGQYKSVAFGQPRPDPANIFAQTKPDSSSIFVSNKPEPISGFDPGKAAQENIFAAPTSQKTVLDMFKAKDEVDSDKAKENIFSSSMRPETKDATNIFASQSGTTQGTTVSDGSGQNIFTKQNIFATGPAQTDPRIQSQKPLFGPPSTSESQGNIFAQKEKPQHSSPQKGGFYFVLDKSKKQEEEPNFFTPAFKPISDVDDQRRFAHEKNEVEIKLLEEKRFRLQEEIKKEMEREDRERMQQEDMKRREEEFRRKNEEAAEKRRLEAERVKIEETKRKQREEQEKIENEKRLLQERIELEKRLEDEKRRKEEEEKILKIELERQIKLDEEKRKDMEIKKTVKNILKKMVETVDLKIRQETLKRIRENIKRRSVIAMGQKWRNIVVKRLKKRKALDCNPTFIHTKSVKECAKDLHSRSQDLTLSNMKRYKLGRPLEIPLLKDPPIGKLNLFYLTYSSLRRRLCELKEKWHQHIYWKVVVSIPDIDEMVAGLHKLEETLKIYINWDLDKYGNTAYIEQHKTVTYCIEKQQGLEVKSSDASALVFIAKSFNDVMQRRVFENLKDYGVYVKLPVVLILEDTSNSDEYLQKLRETGIVSDYVIYSCSLSSQVLPSIIDNGLIFLSKRVEKYPPLEMDTLYSFLTSHLCTEMWKKASSYAKWNHEYNFCMRDPNIVINLYNEGLNLLSKIVTDKKSKEYAIFPEIFTNYLTEKLPNFLPCDYRYFPSFWPTPKYEDQLTSIIKKLRLPKFLEKWPPGNESDLLVSVSKYCTEVFQNPKEPLIKIMNTLKEYIEDENYEKITWTKAIQIIAQEKLKEQDLNLPKPIYSDIFDTFIVVYDVNVLNEYTTSEWFYINNPIIESYKKVISQKLEDEVEEEKVLNLAQNRKRALDISMDPDDIFDVISKAESILRSPKNICLETRSQIEDINRSIRDLEDSINVVKRMDEMNLLKRFIEN